MKKLILAMLLFNAAGWFVPGKAESQSCPGTLMSPEWVECRKVVLAACAYVNAGQSAMCEAAALQRHLLMQPIAQRRGVVPLSAWHCPTSHPIKGNFTTYSGERCIFHLPGGQFYETTKPEMCYATPAEAGVDGCRASMK